MWWREWKNLELWGKLNKGLVTWREEDARAEDAQIPSGALAGAGSRRRLQQHSQQNIATLVLDRLRGGATLADEPVWSISTKN
jgi:hypothetical protein